MGQGRQLSGKVTFELTPNDPKEQAWEKRKERMLQAGGIAKAVEMVQASRSRTERRLPWVEGTEKRGVSQDRDRKGPNDGKPIGCGEKNWKIPVVDPRKNFRHWCNEV